MPSSWPALLRAVVVSAGQYFYTEKRTRVGVCAFVWVATSLQRGLKVLPRAVAAGMHKDGAHGPHYAGVQLADIGTQRL